MAGKTMDKRRSTKKPSKGDRRSALVRGESELTLLKGLSSSSARVVVDAKPKVSALEPNMTKKKDRRRKSTKKPTNGNRRSALANNRGESELTLLRGISSSSTASSLQDLFVDESPVVKDRRKELVKGESSTKLLQGVLSSETTITDDDDSRRGRDRHGIISRAASLFPAQKVETDKKKKKKKLRPQEKLPNVVPPEFVFIPTNTDVSLHIIGEAPELIEW